MRPPVQPSDCLFHPARNRSCQCCHKAASLALMMKKALIALALLPAPALAGTPYVAMGSSYAAAPNIGQSADTPPNRCARSASNAAHIFAQKAELELSDVSCSGATTEHILGPWKELPAQLDALDADTKLVTVTIGGNDLGYMAAIGQLRCPTLSEAERARYFGGACKPFAPPNAEAKAKLAADLDRMIAAIHQRAPKARVLLVQYFALMPASGNCPATGLTDEQVAQIRPIPEALSAITEAAVRPYAAFARIVPLDRASANHGICGAVPWSNGGNPDMSKKDGVNYHPNQAGMQAAAAMIETAWRMR